MKNLTRVQVQTSSSSTGVEADTNGDEDESEEAEVKGRSVRAEEEVSQTRVELIVGALKERLRARVALQRQLDALVKVSSCIGLNPLNDCTIWGVRSFARKMRIWGVPPAGDPQL